MLKSSFVLAIMKVTYCSILRKATMKSILLPGGTGALGSVVVQRLVSEGYRCVVPYHSVEEAQKLRTQFAPQQRDQLLLLEADMLDEHAVAHVFETASGSGGLYGLVHLLGGIRGFQPVAEASIEDWDFLLNLNLRSLFLTARLAMKEFAGKGAGRIVTIGAMASVKPAASQAGYGVAKAGVSALTKILADEGRGSGITANCILPGIIMTEANLSWGAPEDIPKWTPPSDIAAAVSYLLSEAAASVNGSDVRLFGGLNI
jgi:NAD(P)-dependent dehydrogenase (short-subunit alcohol dehydrogenase family)